MILLPAEPLLILSDQTFTPPVYILVFVPLHLFIPFQARLYPHMHPVSTELYKYRQASASNRNCFWDSPDQL